MRPNAVILFAGDSRREELRKGLPPRFLRHLHARIVATMRSLHGIDLFIADHLAPKAESLGARVSQVVADAFDRGYARVVLLAGDVAGLSAELVERAMASKATIGRSPDGGFYILGLSRRPEIDWHTIRWGSGHAFDDVATALGSYDPLPELDDIDSLGDALRVLRAPRFASLYACLQSLIRGSRFVVRGSRVALCPELRAPSLRAPPANH